MHRPLTIQEVPPVTATPRPLSVLLVDPALFTAPYDAALSRGLKANAITPAWATRGLRPNEDADLPAEDMHPLFYPLTDGPRRRGNGRWQRAVKGVEHALGLNALVKRVEQQQFDAVHFQWSVLPFLDLRAIHRIRETAPLILTVHDLLPFNGKKVNRLQRDGFGGVIRAADHVIVHTATARSALVGAGVNPLCVSVIPHGMLPLGKTAPVEQKSDGRWRIVMFGKIQSYKGVDLLVEAAGLLDAETRSRIEIVVAGEPMLPLGDVIERARALGLEDTIRFELRRFSDAEMAVLLTGADSFVFPYRAIEASGVLHLVAGLGKWIVASRLGVFEDMIGADGRFGSLTEAGDVTALAQALAGCIGRTPPGPLGESVPGWDVIGEMTRGVYETAIARHAAARLAA